MTGFRDRLIHGYFSVETIYVWGNHNPGIFQH
ncbi:hypothetical protein ACHM2L_15955 [Clostridium perfringens]